MSTSAGFRRGEWEYLTPTSNRAIPFHDFRSLHWHQSDGRDPAEMVAICATMLRVEHFRKGKVVFETSRAVQ